MRNEKQISFKSQDLEKTSIFGSIVPEENISVNENNFTINP